MSYQFSGDLFAILEIPPDASPAQIKKGYHVQCLKYHPDKLKKLPDRERTAAEARFAEVGTAYQLLRDDERRECYRLGGIRAVENLEKYRFLDRLLR